MRFSVWFCLSENVNQTAKNSSFIRQIQLLKSWSNILYISWAWSIKIQSQRHQLWESQVWGECVCVCVCGAPQCLYLDPVIKIVPCNENLSTSPRDLCVPLVIVNNVWLCAPIAMIRVSTELSKSTNYVQMSFVRLRAMVPKLSLIYI